MLLVAVAWALAFAHAAEYPGKMRLGRDAYLTTQMIYYPGFTIGGATEPLSVTASAALLAFTPPGTATFWLTAIAPGAAVATHLVLTQPINRTWASELKLGKAGATFFSPKRAADLGDWTKLRDRWEALHLARAALMSVALVALVVAITSSRPAAWPAMPVPAA